MRLLPVLLKMSTAASPLKPPTGVRGMQVLDRAAFTKSVTVPCLIIPANDMNKVRKTIKPYLLKLEKMSSVVNGSDSTFKKVLLSPDMIQTLCDLKEADQETLEKLDAKFETTEIEVGYNNWRSEQILQAVLPEDEDGTKAFTVIGHILHLNLHEHLLPYKDLIGQVLLDKVNGVTTVVNKSDPIDNTYRNFTMEVLAGEDNLVSSVKENNCIFHLDFGKVYWNSRLSTEHFRVVDMISKNDVVYDVFAGVGPFAIPAAIRGARVLANDLNPESYKWLQVNVKENKVTKNNGSVECFNMDGREFIQTVIKKDLDELFAADIDPNTRLHIIMNLPLIATTFLNAFKGLLDSSCIYTLHPVPITFHVYCFANYFEPEKLALELVEKGLGFQLKEDLIETKLVRKVSPSKFMVRLTFEYPLNIICNAASDESFNTIESTESVNNENGGENSDENNEFVVKKLCQGTPNVQNESLTDTTVDISDSSKSSEGGSDKFSENDEPDDCQEGSSPNVHNESLLDEPVDSSDSSESSEGGSDKSSENDEPGDLEGSSPNVKNESLSDEPVDSSDLSESSEGGSDKSSENDEPGDCLEGSSPNVHNVSLSDEPVDISDSSESSEGGSDKISENDEPGDLEGSSPNVQNQSISDEPVDTNDSSENSEVGSGKSSENDEPVVKKLCLEKSTPSVQN
ncbi:tRNA (guanine(37)-N1)-methyltransferase [Cloeon dipterum]|uniref:tRNA (guanine(37)-N1)-methyltransferase n=1 Tax=Cloeon dipterum TaxID=197152 RepID=UPI00322023D4